MPTLGRALPGNLAEAAAKTLGRLREARTPCIMAEATLPRGQTSDTLALRRRVQGGAGASATQGDVK